MSSTAELPLQSLEDILDVQSMTTVAYVFAVGSKEVENFIASDMLATFKGTRSS